MFVFVKFDTLQGGSDHGQYAGWSVVDQFSFAVAEGDGDDSDEDSAVKSNPLSWAAELASENKKLQKPWAAELASENKKPQKQKKALRSGGRNASGVRERSVTIGIEKRFDSISTELLKRAWFRARFNSVTLDVCASDAKGAKPVLKLELSGVSVEGCSMRTSRGDDIPQESIQLKCQRLVFQYYSFTHPGQPYRCECQIGRGKSVSK